MSFTTEALKVLDTEPKGLPIQVIANQMGVSVGYARTQLRAMEDAGTIERVDDRLPIYYRVSADSPIVRVRNGIDKAKQALLGNPADPNFIVKKFHAVPKAQWAEAIPVMEAYTLALKELQEEGKLIDTL